MCILFYFQSESPKQLNPILEIRAVAGPMKESQAVKFRNDWKSPVRKTLLSSTPQKCPTSPKQNEFNNKSVEKAGRYFISCHYFYLIFL